MALPSTKSVWPAEKNLLYEFLGATKNSSGQLKLRSKMEVDGLELKRELSVPRGTSVEEGNPETLPPNGCL